MVPVGQAQAQDGAIGDADGAAGCRSIRAASVVENALESQAGYGRELAKWNRVRTLAREVQSSTASSVATSWSCDDHTGRPGRENEIATLVAHVTKSSIAQDLACGWGLGKGDSNTGASSTLGQVAEVMGMIGVRVRVVSRHSLKG